MKIWTDKISVNPFIAGIIGAYGLEGLFSQLGLIVGIIAAILGFASGFILQILINKKGPVA